MLINKKPKLKKQLSLELWIPESNALYFYRFRNHFGKFHNSLDWSKTIWPFPKLFWTYRKTRHNLRTVNWNIFVSFDKSRIWILLILPIPNYPSLIWTNQKNLFSLELWILNTIFCIDINDDHQRLGQKTPVLKIVWRICHTFFLQCNNFSILKRGGL